MSKMWQKFGSNLHPDIEKYTVGQDYMFDRILMPFDIEATKVHAKGLEKIGILNNEELKKILEALSDLHKDFEFGKVQIKIEDEDCHTVIENYLIEKLGDIGKKIHTGRSRNDQSLVALRLYMKKKLREVGVKSAKLAKLSLTFAKEYKNVPLPGYTHSQQAMISSVGHLFCGFVESLLDDMEFAKSIYSHIDKNPLGSAAGYGVSFPLDREFTTKELGFGKIQVNSLYCQNSRGKFESAFLEGLLQVMLTAGKFASDFLLFTMREFGFFEVDDSFLTGSSIMPQKKNLDVMEILRANVGVVMANKDMVLNIMRNLISGYNRDFQLIKKPVIESVGIVMDSLDILILFMGGIRPNIDNIAKVLKQDIFMTDLANTLVKENGISFRDAYKTAKDEFGEHEEDPAKNISSKISLGAPGNLDFDYYEERLNEI